MDWHLTEIDQKYGAGWTGYTWNKDFFPDPKRFTDNLHRRGMKVTLNDHPADGVRAFEDVYPELPPTWAWIRKRASCFDGFYEQKAA